MADDRKGGHAAAGPLPGLLGVIGWVVAVSGLFHGAYLAAESREVTAVLPGLGVASIGLLLVGVAEILSVLAAVERNTRELADQARRAMDEE